MSYKEGRGWDYKFNFFLRRDETNGPTPRRRVSRRENDGTALRAGGRFTEAGGTGRAAGPAPGSQPRLPCTPAPGRRRARSSSPASPQSPDLQAHVTPHTGRPAKLPVAQKVGSSPNNAHTRRRQAATFPRPETAGQFVSPSRGTAGSLPPVDRNPRLASGNTQQAVLSENPRECVCTCACSRVYPGKDVQRALSFGSFWGAEF